MRQKSIHELTHNGLARVNASIYLWYQALCAPRIIDVRLTEGLSERSLFDLDTIECSDNIGGATQDNTEPIREGQSQAKMRHQSACVSWMPKILIQPGADELMVILDQHCAGEIFAESIDGRPTEHDSGKQQDKAQRSDEFSPGVDPANAGEAEDHSNRLDRVRKVPQLRRIPIPIFERLDFEAAQIRIFDDQP